MATGFLPAPSREPHCQLALGLLYLLISSDPDNLKARTAMGTVGSPEGARNRAQDSPHFLGGCTRCWDPESPGTVGARPRTGGSPRLLSIPPTPPVMRLQAQPVARIRARISPPSFQNPACRVRGCHRNLAALGEQGWLLGGVSPSSPSLSLSPKGPKVQGQGLRQACAPTPSSVGCPLPLSSMPREVLGFQNQLFSRYWNENE